MQTERRPLVSETSSDGMIKAQPKGGIIQTTIRIIRLEGWTGLYKGLSINLFRTVPNSAVTMLTCVCLPPAVLIQNLLNPRITVTATNC